MPSALSMLLLVLQVASILYLFFTAIKLINQNHNLRVADRFRSLLVDMLEGMTKHLAEKLNEKDAELKKVRLYADELKERIKILEGKIQYTKRDEEPRYERVDDWKV